VTPESARGCAPFSFSREIAHEVPRWNPATVDGCPGRHPPVNDPGVLLRRCPLTLMGFYVAAMCTVTGIITLFYVNASTALELLLGAMLLVSGLFLGVLTLREQRRQHAAQGTLSRHGTSRRPHPHP
jgi:hypothetical protein